MSENKVKWHPYPQEKPENNSRDPYLVTWNYNNGFKIEPTVDLFYYEDDAFKWNEGMEVTAWAYLPEPYKEENNGKENA